MGIWHNATSSPLRFSFRDEIYEVPPGGEVTMSDAWDWLPPKRGLPLTKGPSPAKDAPRVIPVTPEPVKKTLPDGVTAGDRPVQRDWDDDAEGFIETEESAPEPESPTVAKTLEKLHKQGVKVPGKR